MLSNAYFLAKFRFDTAENEPTKKIAKKNAGSRPLLREEVREQPHLPPRLDRGRLDGRPRGLRVRTGCHTGCRT